MTTPACDHGEKVAYPDERAASRALVECKISRALHNNTRRREQRVYECRHCRSWFLTSRPDLFADAS